MSKTKEKILLTALRLFASDGYEAVSVSRIAQEMGMVKSALYKHYKSKRDIFDSILARMEEMDYEEAKTHEVPEGMVDEMADLYQQTSLQQIFEYSKAMFVYWTEDEFASLFRRMLTIEQYRSSEMAALYQQYLGGGPVDYMTDIFGSMLVGGTDDCTDRLTSGTINGQTDARQMAVEFYSPMFLFYSLYDASESIVENEISKKEIEQRKIKQMLHMHMQRFAETYPELGGFNKEV